MNIHVLATSQNGIENFDATMRSVQESPTSFQPNCTKLWVDRRRCAANVAADCRNQSFAISEGNFFSPRSDLGNENTDKETEDLKTEIQQMQSNCELKHCFTSPETFGEKEDSAALPSLLCLAYNQLGPLILSCLILVAATALLMTLAVTLPHWVSLIISFAVAMGTVLIMFIHCVLQTRSLMVAVASFNASPNSSDCRVRFIADVLSSKITSESKNSSFTGPPACLRAELEAWDHSGDGHIVIDSTGTILWANAALLQYFGYEEDELLHNNVNILMPSHYAEHHDRFIQRFLQTGCFKFLDDNRGRPVPVVNKDRQQSIVPLAIEMYGDTRDADSIVFVGHMRFHEPDVLLSTLRRMMSTCNGNPAPVLEILEGDLMPRVIIESMGEIKFANSAAVRTFGYDSAEEMKHKNVTILMGEPYASAHDRILREYQKRAEVAARSHEMPKSRIITGGRDVVARTKTGQPLPLFLMVDRVDRPSGKPSECLFHARLMPLPTMTRPPSLPSSRESSSYDLASIPVIPLQQLHARHCTVVAIVVRGLWGPGPKTTLQQDYEGVLQLCLKLMASQRGILLSVCGETLLVLFNSSTLPCAAHRCRAAAFATNLTTHWAKSSLSVGMTLHTAAVSGLCHSAVWGTRTVYFGEAVSKALCFLQVAVEMQASGTLVESALRQELHYTYCIRLVNKITLHPVTPYATDFEVFELVAAREMQDNEWLYQLPSMQEGEAQELVEWQECWRCLLSSPPAIGEALVWLQTHMTHSLDDDESIDRTAHWLMRVLQNVHHRTKTSGTRTASTTTYDLWFARE